MTSSLDGAASVYGQPVTFTATVAPVFPGEGTPTGSVVFTLIQTGQQETVTLDGQDEASIALTDFTGSAAVPGTYDISAEYLGDTNFTGSTFDDFSQTVEQANTTTELDSSVNPANYGNAVTLTATVVAMAPGAGTPTGTVTFTVSGTPHVVNLVDGTASYDLGTLAADTYAISAVYSGDTNFAASNDSLNQVINGLVQGTVFEDLNADGVRDGAEGPLGGVPVNLYLIDLDTGQATSVENAVSAADGTYTFVATAHETYVVVVGPKAGYGFSADNPDVDTSGTSAFFQVTSVTTINAGLAPYGGIAGRAWDDANNDGIQGNTTDEPGLSGITVTLFQEGEQIGDPQTTAADGTYSFPSLPPGDYYLKFSQKTNYAFSPQGAGSDRSIDSDADQFGVTAAFTVDLAATTHIDAGEAPYGSVSGFVWDDANNDGIQDEGQDEEEEGVANVSVQLYATSSSIPVATATSDADGRYQFAPQAPGSYYIVVTQPNDYAFSLEHQGDDATKDSDVDDTGTSDTFSIDLGTTVQEDVGLAPYGTVSGKVWDDANNDGIQGDEEDEPGVANVTVTLINADDGVDEESVLTGSDGTYSFAPAPPGNYYVLVTPPAGSGFSPEGAGGDATLDSDVDATGQSESFAVDLTTTTAIDAGLVPDGSVSGTVWYDDNADGIQDGGSSEPGLAEVTVSLYSTDDPSTPVQVSETDSEGTYTFASVAPGSYYVQVSGLYNFYFSPEHAGSDDVDSDVNAEGASDPFTVSLDEGTQIDAGLVPFQTISGIAFKDLNDDGVLDDGEAPLSGIDVTLSQDGDPIAQTTTDADGAYEFDELLPGAYSVTFTLPAHYAFSPEQEPVAGEIVSEVDSQGDSAELNIGPDAEVNAGLVPFAKVTGTVFQDKYLSGVDQPGDPVAPNIQVALYTADDSEVDSTTTDNKGQYEFLDVAPGSYYVKFTAPDGDFFSPKDKGAAGQVDSDVSAKGQSDDFEEVASTPAEVDAGLILPSAPNFAEPGELSDTPTGAQGDDPMSAAFSDAGVRYADGIVEVSSSQLSSAGFGSPWGQDVTWTNNPFYSQGSVNGSGMVDAEMPRLIDLDGDRGALVVLSGGSNARFFKQQDDGSYKESLFLVDTLSYQEGTDTYTFADPNGDQFVFNGFGTDVPANAQGQMTEFIAANGEITTIVASNGRIDEAVRSALVNGATIVEAYLYSYNSGGLIANVALERSYDDGATWGIVRQVSYVYYGVNDPDGNPGDLEFATVQDGAGNPLDVYYYRYYITNGAGGYANGLKSYFDPESYARLAADVGNPTLWPDAVVAPYANVHLQYDAQHRVSRADVQGAGGTATGGIGSYFYSYQASSNQAGVNNWSTRTVETLPDNNQNIVYSNAYDEPMLTAFASGGQQWVSFTQYDDAGRVSMQANPSGVLTYDDTNAGLVFDQDGNNLYLDANAGLFTTIGYDSNTGFEASTAISDGLLGTPIPQSSMTYSVQTANGVKRTLLASSTVYPNADGSGSATTNYAYTFFAGTLQPATLTTTLPTIFAAQNGNSIAAVTTTVYDSYGNASFYTDAEGHVSFMSYDVPTGALTQTIVDFSGLNLTTTMDVDPLGRTTELIDPNGNITYTVYLDTQHEMRVYPGWTANGDGTYRTTGPIQVTRDDRGNGYTETLTMAVAPQVSSNGTPTGGEPIANLQTLSRTYYNRADQAVEQDDYFDLSNVVYSTLPHIGTTCPQAANATSGNYYVTLTSYDARGRANQTVTANGTVYTTVFDGLGRAVASLVGSTLVTTNEYDNGLVGDGNLTMRKQYPGGSAAPQETDYWYDWRDRMVANKQGVQSSEDANTNRPLTVVTYDNLGDQTNVQQYDGDQVTVSVDGNGTPQLSAPPGIDPGTLRRAQTSYSYDKLGRLYQTQVFNVDQTIGYAYLTPLVSNTYYDLNGNVVAQSSPTGLWTKTAYNGAGEAIAVYSTDNAGSNPFSVQQDNVYQQTETAYDGDGNVILTTMRQRFDNETATGPLGNALSGPQSRVSYVASYYDAANRLTDTVNVGTNGGVPWTRPESVPDRSGNVLVTHNARASAHSGQSG